MLLGQLWNTSTCVRGQSLDGCWLLPPSSIGYIQLLCCAVSLYIGPILVLSTFTHVCTQSWSICVYYLHMTSVTSVSLRSPDSLPNLLSTCLTVPQVKEEGYEIAHDGRLITVFSAPNYCDQMGNKGAFVRFNGTDMVPHFTTFEAVPHPDVKPMAYASSFLR